MAKEKVQSVPDVMLADTPMEEREQILRDSCDQIVEKFYTRKFGEDEKNEKRAEACNVAIQIGELNEELKNFTADIKGKLKPLQERQAEILNEVKAGGEQIKGDTFKFVFEEAGKVGFYDTNGHLVESRDMTREERQRTVFQAIRNTGTEG